MVKQASHSDPKRYTKPELRDKIKAEVTAGDKGGKPGQWSARKAQLVAHEYEQAGGDYKQERGEEQKSLQQWGEEDWHTADGQKAQREGGTARYLPDEAWKELSPEQKAATNRKKQRGSREGKQFVANTPEASAARKRVAARKESTSGKNAAKGAVANTSASEKAAAKKAPADKTAAKKTVARKTATKKGSARKAPAKKVAAKTAAKTAGKKAPTKESSLKKTSGR